MTLRIPTTLACIALATTAASAEEVSVDTYLGEARVATAPATIAVLDAAAIDTISALGVTVDAVPAMPALAHLTEAMADAARVGSLFEPDFEALAVLNPDLIIAGGRSSRQVEPLSEIAPTLDMTIWGGDMVNQAQARLSAYGAIFEREALAAELSEALLTRVEEAAAAVEGQGNALILLTNGGNVSAYGDDSRFGWLHTALDLPEAYPDLTAETHGESVSFEFIAEVDPDWILVIDRAAAIGQDGEAAAATLDNALVASTTAAEEDQIIYLSSGPLYLAGGGVQSMMLTLDEIIAGFGE
ncbi:siderophore ABC transporter substrate-binding protein [Gymnodinialimonas ceratoperidinii]|uniref:Siderophore ABC transporter substrate-binding protein n=1 Tax=Gymnodinialimonas ceratoperidinii TaxID=2856823 RepID=A0A8F6YAX4_9RHOB|nr:siderophore ABC transporter substrate-binding protein [Gymnodinialimonas ceratoperidinii]QXT39486.1 siderophore ABC transporter substrate-binding protein [Gymnodinialimonas ceratoperidinii]